MFGDSAIPLNAAALIAKRNGHRVRLAQASTEEAQAQGYLAQFAEQWGQVRARLDDMLALPGQLQQARADLDAVRRAAIDAGDAETAQQAETLYADVQAHEDQAAQVAATVQQYRDTWNQLAAYIGGTWGSVVATAEDWWTRAKRAVGLGGLGVLPLVPIAVIAVAVAGLAFAAVTGLAVLAWWQTTNATISGVKNKTLPSSALGPLSGLSGTVMWVAAAVTGVVVLSMLGGGGGRR